DEMHANAAVAEAPDLVDLASVGGRGGRRYSVARLQHAKSREQSIEDFGDYHGVDCEPANVMNRESSALQPNRSVGGECARRGSGDVRAGVDEEQRRWTNRQAVVATFHHNANQPRETKIRLCMNAEQRGVCRSRRAVRLKDAVAWRGEGQYAGGRRDPLFAGRDSQTQGAGGASGRVAGGTGAAAVCAPTDGEQRRSKAQHV